jgi:hypothetical protein
MNHALESPETGLTLEYCEHRGGRFALPEASVGAIGSYAGTAFILFQQFPLPFLRAAIAWGFVRVFALSGGPEASAWLNRIVFR